jgi:hypothetical protein
VDNTEPGEPGRRRTTYFETCTDDQAPHDKCDVHGDVPRDYRKVDTRRGDGNVPRAIEVKSETTNTPISMKAATVVGTDPYNSIQAVNSVAQLKALDTPGATAPIDNNPTAEPGASDQPGVQVLKAEKVGPLEQTPTVDSAIKLEPPKPLEF